MLRQLCVIVALACSAQLAQAAEAGKIIFVAGVAQSQGKPVAEGAAVQEGDLLSTGPTGFIYVKTIDNGLFILRPNTQARIAAYHIDAKVPANTRIKLELLSGVARSRSGDAVKQARQNFRFNTPVAAIGVRGTDFTVFTDRDTSRVSVLAGGVVVSGFGGGCRPEGGGPCEGAASRELSATQRGVLLEIQRGQAAPKLLQNNGVGPDQAAPPRPDEPIGKNGGVNSDSTLVAAPSLDPKKNDTLAQNKPAAPPPIVLPPPGNVIEAPDNRPDAKIVWGRWLPLLDLPRRINFDVEKSQNELYAVNGNYALFRTEGKPYIVPNEGKIGFAMKDGEAFIYSTSDTGVQSVQEAALKNGKLNIDFGARSFVTSVDLTSKVDALTLTAQGTIGNDGGLHGDRARSVPGLIDVKGLLSTERGGSAAYIFSGRLDSQRTVNGATYWER